MQRHIGNFPPGPSRPCPAIAAGALFALVLSGAACEEPAAGEGEGEGEGEPTGCDDPVLGGFVLAPGYVVIESALLPIDTSFAGLSAQNGGPARLLGLRGDLLVYDFGALPTLAATPEPLFDALIDTDQALAPGSDVFPSFLVVGSTASATGYTRASDFGGAIGAHPLTSGASSYLDAPANFSATLRGNVLIVSGAGLADAQDGLGLYATSASAAFLLASLGTDAVASGYLAATTSGVLVAGQFTSENQLFAIAPGDVDDVLAGGPALSLASRTAFLTGDYGALAGFGDAVAIARYDPATWGTTSLVDVALPVAGGAVTPGTPVPILSQNDGCTTGLPFLAPHQGDLLVGVALPDGVRVVRIARE